MLTRILNAGQAPSGDQDWKRRMTQAPSARRFRSRVPLKVGIVTAVVYFFLGTAWAFSSPIFSVPDEYSHAVKAAAVVRGEILPTSVTVGEVVTVPAWLESTSWYCFVNRPEVTADCQTEMTQSTSLTRQVTSAGRYPPFYYALAGAPSLLLQGSSAFYAQREITVVLSALLLGLAAWSASATPRGGRVLLSLGIAITPMSAYLMGAVNPQALEIAAAAGVWISGWALLFQSQSKFDSGALARLTVSASALALCRPLSVLWLALITVILLLGFSRTEHWALLRESVSAKICGGVVVAVCLAQTFWVVSMGALTQSTLGVHMSTAKAIVTSISRQYWWLAQAIGQFGWLDTNSWWPVYVVWLVAETCLVLTAFRLASRRERLALVLLMAGSIVIPTLAEVTTREQTGFAWQGRYTLPLTIGIVLMSGMIVSRRFRSIADARSWDRVARFMIVPMLGAAHFLAWGSALRRYSVGASSDFPFSNFVIKWAPPGGAWTWVFVMGLSCGLFTLWLQWAMAASESADTQPVMSVQQAASATFTSRSELGP